MTEKEQHININLKYKYLIRKIIFTEKYEFKINNKTNLF